MMKRLLSIPVLIQCLACSGTPTRSDNGFPAVDDFKESLVSSNIQLWGGLRRGEKIKDFSEYTARIRGVGTSASRVVHEQITSGVEGVVHIVDSTFYVCLRSVNLKYTMCDKADSPRLDCIVRSDLPPDVDEFYDKLFSYDCNTARMGY